MDVDLVHSITCRRSRQNNGIFDQHRRGTNTTGLTSACQTSVRDELLSKKKALTENIEEKNKDFHPVAAAL